MSESFRQAVGLAVQLYNIGYRNVLGLNLTTNSVLKSREQSSCLFNRYFKALFSQSDKALLANYTEQDVAIHA